MKKARFTLIIIALCLLSACTGPSLRYKKNILESMNEGSFDKTASIVEKNKSKQYGNKNAVLYYLDLSTAQSSAYDNQASKQSLTSALEITDNLSVKSVSASLGTLIINDNTVPYNPPVYEQALMHFFLAMDYLYGPYPEDSLVEANRAVFLLDNNREKQTKDLYNDDAFVQYFSSMIFEDNGKLSDARIARINAENAYKKQSESRAQMPQVYLPENYQNLGEAVIFHYNGKAPVKISKSLMLAWDDIWFAVDDNSDLNGVGNDVIDAVYAGAYGKSVTISMPEYKDVDYHIKSSAVSADGGPLKNTTLVSDISFAAKQTLKQNMSAIYMRTATRAVTKYILSVQAKHIAQKNGGDTMGTVVGSLFSILSNISEKADTRSWFTLPAEIRMANLFLTPGVHDIKLVLFNADGQAIDEYVFENVKISKGKRTYLYHRTSK